MSGQYHLLSLSIGISVLYLISYLAVRMGFFKPKLHSAIWNLVLLLGFLVAGLLGFLLVIMVNYKIELSFVGTITQVHVDSGIILFFVSIYHILWHFNYFKQLVHFKNKSFDTKSQDETVYYQDFNEGNPDKWKLLFSLVLLGFTSLIAQTLMIREFISTFSGNELIIGMIMSNWMIINGLGAYAWRYSKTISHNKQALPFMHLLIGILPIMSLLALFSFKNLIFPVGMQVNYVQLYFVSLIFLFPLCFASGYAFSLIGHQYSMLERESKIHINYSIESAGSLIGGVVFSFFLVFIAGSLQILAGLFVLNALAIYVYRFRLLKKWQHMLLVFILIPIFLLALPDTEKLFKSRLYPNQNLLEIKQSPYGQIMIAENMGQLNFYRNGDFLYALDTTHQNNSNLAIDEESVHFAMVQPDKILNVLMLSGTITCALKEVLKYPIKTVDCIEIDPIVSELSMKYNLELKNPKVTLIAGDAMDYIKKTKKKYDVILSAVPAPSGTETNRFYTLQFFQQLKNKMTEESVLEVQLPSTVNYIDTLSTISNSLIYSTLDSVFENVSILPGEKNYFLASNKTLDTRIVEKLKSKGIESEYIAYYLDDFSIATSSEQMKLQIKGKSQLNTDLKPMSYLLYIQQQLSMYKGSYWLLIGFVAILIILMFRDFNSIRFAMFSAGFASISMELLIIYLFQMVFGAAYYYLSIIFTLFMLGLTIGPFVPLMFLKGNIKKGCACFTIFFGILVLLLPSMLNNLVHSNLSANYFYAIFFISSVLGGLLTGFLFKMTAQLSGTSAGETAGAVYSADLFGSAIGAILFTFFILPFVGVLYSGFFSFLLCLAASIFVLIFNRVKHQ